MKGCCVSPNYYAHGWLHAAGYVFHVFSCVFSSIFQGVHSRGTVPPKSQITIDLGQLVVDLDLSIVDRIASLLWPGALYKASAHFPDASVHHMYNSLATGRSAVSPIIHAFSYKYAWGSIPWWLGPGHCTAERLFSVRLFEQRVQLSCNRKISCGSKIIIITSLIFLKIKTGIRGWYC